MGLFKTDLNNRSVGLNVGILIFNSVLQVEKIWYHALLFLYMH